MKTYDVVWVWENNAWTPHFAGPGETLDGLFKEFNNKGKLAYKGLKTIGPPDCKGPASDCLWCGVVAKTG